MDDMESGLPSNRPCASSSRTVVGSGNNPSNSPNPGRLAAGPSGSSIPIEWSHGRIGVSALFGWYRPALELV